ncbi:protein-disulfide reductase DsbD [Marinomonas posidonica]|uniref:Protein-disulfide reductase n=1 Tax=Marinomonas posidonica (strain CECT 7376 / NCIMB 14433 / IVIA-Po-181) TaxID=491952 RepID=F6CUM0_MARPP|nr:protein-disulfide reductase DsbD [Marinomonas posidonica]AEF54130.1 Protein-disulfide reductase [Marinomonas posidonica IVIA-Po-181]
MTTLSLFGLLYLLNLSMRLLVALSAFIFHFSAYAFTFAPTTPFEKPQFLPVEQAFQLSISAPIEGQFHAQWNIADGYYLYQQRFSISGPQASHLHFAPLPTAQDHEDEYYGKVMIYRQQVRLPMYYDIQLPAGTTIQATLHYQGCADQGLCYPPQTVPIQFKVPEGLTTTEADTDPSSVTNAINKASTTEPSVLEPSAAQKILTDLQDNGLLQSMMLMFGLGLLLSLTPCVLPMIPIVSAIVIGTQTSTTEGPSRFRGGYLSLMYVLGMAFTYAAIGGLVGLLGLQFNLQAKLQSPLFVVLSAAIFVMLALAMFGVFQLQMPSSWQNKLTAFRIQTSSPWRASVSVFIAGILATLIVSPCVSAPLAGTLLYISSQGDALYGAFILFVMALGMGVPLLLVGLFGPSILPKRGDWLEDIKVVFGFGLLAVAIWLLTPWLPLSGHLFLWSALALAMSGYFVHRAITVASHPVRWFLVLILFLIGSVQMVGGFSGGSSPLQPLQGIRLPSNSTTSIDSLFDAQIGSLEELDQLLANTDSRPMVLDLYADWCVSCKTVEAILASSEAQALLPQVRLVRVDVTDNSLANQALMKHFNLYGPPSLVFLNAAGHPLPQLALIGEPSKAELISRLKRLQTPF